MVFDSKIVQVTYGVQKPDNSLNAKTSENQTSEYQTNITLVDCRLIKIFGLWNACSVPLPSIVHWDPKWEYVGPIVVRYSSAWQIVAHVLIYL